MGMITQASIDQLQALMDQVEEPLKRSFQCMHQGYPTETYVRFLKAREGIIMKAFKMLVDCLKWRVENGIDDILAKPIIPVDLYRAVRDSQLVGLSGYTKEGLPVLAIGVGLSSLDKASAHYYIQSHIQINEYRDRVILPATTKKHGKHINKCLKVLDMTGLKISALSQIKLVTIISTIDDLNYPEKTLVYYIVNAPYVFSACWKVVKPLLHERTRKKVQVLSGNGRDDLLKIMEHTSLPHFCRKEEGSSGSSRNTSSHKSPESCYLLDHPFHQQFYTYMKQQAAAALREAVTSSSSSSSAATPVKQGSFLRVALPDASSAHDHLHNTSQKGFSGSLDDLTLSSENGK
ncbi:phosphatidylinositol/phosphatidylcholine transfer protein SFH9-like [Impatiens glandulifera]|uniref:phosphatidylinositol/phosphatidylcholine transfer protein SFH9-like n=1 Tax=Impatiens glandulifera TaxID=253017 RepID=UPI001FB05A68|nr:phosphatidylinositol/phosphatidylcholine transfer protein SFH9-like [Impatiens glandulifera]